MGNTELTWFGDRPLPRWHGKRSEFSVIENEYLERCLTRRKEGGRRRDPGFADFLHFRAERIHNCTTTILLHMLFGVAT
jgi:hypothetical protein